MASEQPRPELANRSSSIHSMATDSLSTTPPQKTKAGAHKHVVGHKSTHARVPSTKSLYKLAKGGNSREDLKKLNRNVSEDVKKLARNTSTSSLKKNTSNVALAHAALALKRNRSSADVKRPKSSGGEKKKDKGRGGAVSFEIGDGEEEDGGWEEASSSASPALSRSVSRLDSRPGSSRPSAENSGVASPTTADREEGGDTGGDRDGEETRRDDAKRVTERLLLRTPSLNTTKMSLAIATPIVSSSTRDQGAESGSQGTLSGTPGQGSMGGSKEMSSRFVGGSGTPSERSSFLHNPHQTQHHTPSHTRSSSNGEEVKKSHSMGNLTYPSIPDEETSTSLLPRSRKTSAAYTPQPSRTQQKLWLQRASSAMEPAGTTTYNGQGSLVGDSKDPRIRSQLEKTGMEYLVVRRYQDPVGAALRRLGRGRGVAVAGPRRGIDAAHGKRGRGRGVGGGSGEARASYDGTATTPGSISERGEEDDERVGVGSLLRSLWEKNFDLIASAD